MKINKNEIMMNWRDHRFPIFKVINMSVLLTYLKYAGVISGKETPKEGNGLLKEL